MKKRKAIKIRQQAMPLAEVAASHRQFNNLLARALVTSDRAERREIHDQLVETGETLRVVSEVDEEINGRG